MIIFQPSESINHIKPYLPETAVIVEAGAYNGADTLKLSSTWPDGRVHAFEPVPELFEKLSEKTKNHANITCHEYAFSEKNGVAFLHVAENPKRPNRPSQASSLLEPKDRLKHSPITFPHQIEVPTITLDSWANKNNIQRVDLLWLDMQGHELAVLKASKQILPTVKVIFTEVSFIESYEKIPQVDEITSWLEQNGFTLIGQDYEPSTSHFFGNRLFVRNRT